mmetsp:Transcript_2393/g.6347  ORF Transcript_2393/g.6347 Transcript_2393/m.6347 type:complete len:319 (+) Transcript_2393:120-1076(+)
MAPRPNRKNVAALAQSLSQLELAAPTSHFLPLTHPKESVHAPQQQQAVAPAAPLSGASYWDWPADDSACAVARQSSEDALSTDNIEANLIRDSNRLSSKEQAEEQDGTDAANDTYWAERTVPLHQQAPATAATADYWYWSNSEPAVSPKQALLASILAADAARVATSAEHMQSSMTHQAPCEAVQVETTKSQNDAYWAWESPVVAAHVVEDDDSSMAAGRYWDWSSQDQRPSKEQQKVTLIQAILAMESARQALSTDRMVELQMQNDAVSGAQSSSENDAYWQWSEQQELDGNSYWNWSSSAAAPKRAVVATGGYWDW